MPRASANDSTATGPRNASPPALWAQAAHDLRQPIQSLLLLTHVMSSSSDDAQRRQMARSMEDALVALQSMLDGLAGLAKLESRLEAPRFGPCLLPDICARAAAGLDDIIAGRGVHLRVSAAPVTVTSDPRLLETVIAGLVLNALKYGTGKEILLRSRQSDDRHRVEIVFRGPAISDLQQKAIFIEVQRRSGPPASSELAHGIGFLARLSSFLGGSLECASVPKGGQCLALVVPFGDPVDRPR